MAQPQASSKLRILFFSLIGLVVAALVLGLSVHRAPKVSSIRLEPQTLAEVLALSGQVHGVKESDLAPEITGTIAWLKVDEGDRVQPGQLLAQLEDSHQKADVERAERALDVAKAKLVLARRPPLDSQIKEVQSEVLAQRQEAQASLKASQERLALALKGPRLEQQRQAYAAWQQAQATAEQKQRESKRQAILLTKGAISRQASEQAATAAAQAIATQDQAKARLEEFQNGTRPEEIREAQAAVVAAEAQVQAAKNAGAARLQQLADIPRPEDVNLATAQVAEAQSALKLAQTQWAKTKLVAPMSGVIGRRFLQAGDQTGPQAPIFTFSSAPALEIRVDIDEADRFRLALGQQAKVRANGYPDEFTAILHVIPPEIDSLRGTLQARFTPTQTPKWLLPGQSVNVNILLSEDKPHLVLPLTCVRLRGERSEVALIQDNTVELREVFISSPTTKGYVVHSGLKEADVVALAPQGLSSGQHVRPFFTAP